MVVFRHHNNLVCFNLLQPCSLSLKCGAINVEFTVCNTSATQVANFRAQTFSYFTAFPLLFRPSHFISPFDFFTFAVAPLHVFKRSYYYTNLA